MAQQLAHDTFYNLEGGRTEKTAERWVAETQDWVLTRAQVVAKLLNITLPPNLMPNEVERDESLS